MSEDVESSGETAQKPKKKVGRPFVKGFSGNPGGRPSLPPDLKAALAADTMEHYVAAKRIAARAEQEGDLRTASTVRLALLRKTVPDATELVLSMPEGLTVRQVSVDPRKLTEEQLKAILAAQEVAREGK